MQIVCLDLEGVLVPEIWIRFAEATNIAELRKTTRDVPDYDQLMRYRLKILAEHELGLQQIQKVVATIDPLTGAVSFLDELRQSYQLIILSDTFYEFAQPLMKKLNWPTLFCHSLKIAENGSIQDYCLRMANQKQEAICRFKQLNFTVVAAGDSFNDTTMLAEADAGIFFNSPESIIKEYPQYPVAHAYSQLRQEIDQAFVRLAGKV